MVIKVIAQHREVNSVQCASYHLSPPSVNLKDEQKNTSIQITCLDEEDNVLKRVTSEDSL